jgi:hypothetical protein
LVLLQTLHPWQATRELLKGGRQLRFTGFHEFPASSAPYIRGPVQESCMEALHCMRELIWRNPFNQWRRCVRGQFGLPAICGRASQPSTQATLSQGLVETPPKGLLSKEEAKQVHQRKCQDTAGLTPLTREKPRGPEGRCVWECPLRLYCI